MRQESQKSSFPFPILPIDWYFAALHPDASDQERLVLAAVMASDRAGYLGLDVTEANDPSLLRIAQQIVSPYLHREGSVLYLRKNFDCLQAIALDLKRLLCPITSPGHSHQELTEEQSCAISIALSNTVAIIEGGAGTGKTHLTSTLVQAVDGNVVLTAPTGKAAARLQQYNPGTRCCTLHSLVGWPNCKTPAYVAADLIIVDEASMIPACLLARLLHTIKVGQRVIFLGDKNQLPPVDSGSVFIDVLDQVPTAHLTQCLRSDRPDILQLAHDVLNQNEVFPDGPLSRKTLLETKNKVILTPLREGPWGVNAINNLMYSATATQRKKHSVPILITKNTRAIGVYNGEVGTLWIEDGKPLYALFDGKEIPASRLPPYELAFALSVHKSQGSEFDDIMVLLPPGSEIFGREMLYTAVTRARKSVTIHGEKETIHRMTQHSKSQRKGGIQPFLHRN